MIKNIPWETLRGRLQGELSLQAQDLNEHAEDASMFRELPLAVVWPKNGDDCQRIVAFCLEHKVSIHPWGAGTSRGGQPLGPGLVVNFRRHMNRILGFDEETFELTCEPGAYYADVQKFLRPKGRSFPPDPSWHQCTVGGMIANNAAGIHSVKYGGTVEHVAGLEFVCGEGILHSTDEPDSLAEDVHELLEANKARIEAEYPNVEKNSSGYNLHRGLNADGFLDLPRLLTGSEGSLGLITKCRLFTTEIPGATALALLYYPSLEAALAAAMDLRRFDVAACELVDKVLLDLHAAHSKKSETSVSHHAKKITGNRFLDRFYELNAEAVLIVELEGRIGPVALGHLREAVNEVRPRPLELKIAETHDEEALIWDLRRHTSPILNRLENGKITIKPLWGVEDVSLPPETFLAYVKEQKEIFARFGLTCSFFGHAASCNLHIDPLAVDPRQARVDLELARLYDQVADESFKLVIKHGGAISGEHGDGLVRTKYLPLQYPKTYPLFAELKKLFDPYGILNPGKIVLTK